MIPWLFQHDVPLLLRVAGAAVLSFLIVLLLGPRVIRWLIRRKLGDRPEFDRADLNQLTKHKSNTPTMGGILIVVAIFASVVLFADIRDNMYIKTSLVALLWLGGLGAFDDWLKLRRASGQSSRDGLKMWEKMVFQIGLSVLVAIFIWKYGQAPWARENPAHSLYLPLTEPIKLGILAYVIIAAIMITGFSNAVNLTDGMDGLASGCMVIASAVFLILSEVSGDSRMWSQFFGTNMPMVRDSAEMTILCASMLGSCLGFMWYNANPAQVFMGDTGSLPLGGLLGYAALVTRHEVILLIAGGVFVVEALSVVLQVGHFKWTKRKYGEGRRLFRCAPLHHHFHLGGWAESKVVARFWIVGIILAALALATLKLR